MSSVTIAAGATGESPTAPPAEPVPAPTGGPAARPAALPRLGLDREPGSGRTPDGVNCALPGPVGAAYTPLGCDRLKSMPAADAASSSARTAVTRLGGRADGSFSSIHRMPWST